MTPRPPGSVPPDASAVLAERRRIGEGVIREVHAYCEGSCPRRESCPGMECRQYRREMAARDELLTLDDIDAQAHAPATAFGVSLAPTV